MSIFFALFHIFISSQISNFSFPLPTFFAFFRRTFSFKNLFFLFFFFFWCRFLFFFFLFSYVNAKKSAFLTKKRQIFIFNRYAALDRRYDQTSIHADICRWGSRVRQRRIPTRHLPRQHRLIANIVQNPIGATASLPFPHLRRHPPLTR